VKRVGQVVVLRPDRIEDYERLHSAPWPAVIKAIHNANIRNYTIYRHGTRLFASFEYVGDDYVRDMAAMAADPVVQAWWTHTEAMQQALPDRESGSW
jgi:L-rhamnose mutarotase